MKDYYKVVSKFQNRLYSATAGRIGMRDWVEYKKDHWATAPFGGLLVFDNLPDAYAYCTYSPGLNLEIWKCEVRFEVPLPEGAAFHPSQLLRVWMNMPCDTFPWPSGTRAFKKVKLIEKIS